MKLSISDYETGSLAIYIFPKNHKYIIEETELEDIVLKLGHNATNCEWFVFTDIEIKVMNDES